MDPRILLAAIAAACAPEPRTHAPVATMDRWVRVTDADDPFAGEGGDDAACDTRGVVAEPFEEAPSLAVYTQLCGRVTVAQGALAEVPRGDELRVWLYHDELVAPEPAEAVFAVAIGGAAVWRDRRDIPQEVGAFVLGKVPLPDGVPHGAQVAFHLHNHGRNSYHLLEIAAGPPDPP